MIASRLKTSFLRACEIYGCKIIARNIVVSNNRTSVVAQTQMYNLVFGKRGKIR